MMFDALRPPRARGRLPLAWLIALALVSVASAWALERVVQAPIHPRFTEMVEAARAMQTAQGVLWAEKTARDVLPEPGDDPNRTGMIGLEFTPITTTLGELASKRTATNPDFAAALVRLIATLEPAPGAPIVLVLSGSFVGGDLSAIIAAEALGLRPIVVVSLTASMYGTNNPEFTLLDMIEALRSRGVIKSRPIAAVLGGFGAVGRGIDAASMAMLRQSAARNNVPLIDEQPFARLVDTLLARVKASTATTRPVAVINVGGAQIGFSSCRDASELPPGLIRTPVSCGDGTPGLAVRLLQEGLPVIHVLNLRRMALEMGLPFDPVPLPRPGDNAAVYGAAR